MRRNRIAKAREGMGDSLGEGTLARWQRPASINVCGEINRVTAVADGLLSLICVPVRNENLDIAEHST